MELKQNGHLLISKMNQKEIFNLLAHGIIDALPQGEQFERTVLWIMCLDENVVEFNAKMINGDVEKSLEINMGYKYAKAVLKLHQITQNEPPIHKNWNRAKYTLYPEGKMNIEYIWDQELQDEVDRHNNEY